MPPQPVTVNGTTFPSKAELEAYTKALLRRYKPGQQLDMFDQAFMTDLLLRHPSADEKIGCGVASISVERMGFNTQGFMLTRVDGTRIDFSYKQCIRPFTHASKIKFALRRAIVDQVLDVKEQVFPGPFVIAQCPVTGKPMEYHEAHVDHEPPLTFAALVEAWMAERGLTFDDIPTHAPADGIGAAIPDAIAADWAEWRRCHARLRVISAYANLHLVR